jgi:hypothetical protein
MSQKNMVTWATFEAEALEKIEVFVLIFTSIAGSFGFVRCRREMTTKRPCAAKVKPAASAGGSTFGANVGDHQQKAAFP